MTRTLSSRRSSRAFTLVELSIVVVIVGLLATLAVVGYRRIVTSAHSAEATQMVNAIRVAQESYRAETGSYAGVNATIAWGDTSGALTNGAETYPQQGALGSRKMAWGAPCTWCAIDMNTLPVHTDGPVMYGYTTIAGVAGVGPTAAQAGARVNGATVVWPTNPTTDWYVVSGVGDSNGDAIFTTVIGSSFANDLWVDRDGS